jgi:adenylate kinase family enzyme
MLVVNLWGGPGSGKSTGACYIFAQLKLLGVNCEYVSEY